MSPMLQFHSFLKSVFQYTAVCLFPKKRINMGTNITRFSIFIFGLILLFSCSEPKPRKPINHTTGMDQSSSIAFNKRLYESEASMIQNFMKNDSLHQFIDSQHGFWYAYINKVKSDVMPVKGNSVSLQYDIWDFNGNEIYSKDEIGNVLYKVDQEEIIKGLQEGVKWMHIGEKIIFLLPSHKAYAYHGDENKIGPNTPIVVTVELLNIQN
jgi:gliding motility-associated peptidyl-prolyl isomerase